MASQIYHHFILSGRSSLSADGLLQATLDDVALLVGYRTVVRVVAGFPLPIFMHVMEGAVQLGYGKGRSRLQGLNAQMTIQQNAVASSQSFFFIAGNRTNNLRRRQHYERASIGCGPGQESR